LQSITDEAKDTEDRR